MNRLIVLLVGLLGAANLSADFLYWQVSDQVFTEDSGVYDEFAANAYKTDPDSGHWAAAVRYGRTDTDYASWNMAVGEKTGETIVEGTVGLELPELGSASRTDLAEYIDLSAIANYESMSYYIELYHYNEGGWWDGVARSTPTWSYSDLQNGGYITTALAADSDLANVAVWQGSGYSIPEPTSAMLLMIGLSLVGLKRKRA